MGRSLGIEQPEKFMIIPGIVSQNESHFALMRLADLVIFLRQPRQWS